MKTMISLIAFFVFSCVCFGEGNTLVVPTKYATIQQAIAAAKEGDTVEIQPGSYDEALIFKNGIHLRGTADKGVIIHGDGKTAPVLMIQDCSSGTVSDITLTHTSAEAPCDPMERYSLLKISDSSVNVKQCILHNSLSNGIRIEGEGHTEIADCDLRNNASSGIVVYHGKGHPSLKRNCCVENGVNGIYFIECDAGTVECNRCERNRYNGISVVGKGTSPQLVQNQCHLNQTNGIYLGDEVGSMVEDNVCEGNGYHGISVALGGLAEVKNNTLIHNKRCGLFGLDGTQFILKDNVIRDNGEINIIQLRYLIMNNRFDELEAIAAQLRGQKSRFTNGNLQLRHFYYSLGERWADYTPSCEEWLFCTLDQWIQKKPQSITPWIVKAKACASYAWKARGCGWAEKVSQAGWEGFHEKLQKAWDILCHAESLEENDPEVYSVFLLVAMGLNKSENEMDLLFEKGIGIDKAYYSVYYQRAMSLMPRWGGRPGQLASFVQRAAELQEGVDGDMLYAQLVSDMVVYYHNMGMDVFLRLGFSYPKAKRGHIEIQNKYPEASYYLNCFCLLASVYKDKETAKDLFEKIGDDPDMKVWRKDATYQQYRDWANDTASTTAHQDG